MSSTSAVSDCPSSGIVKKSAVCKHPKSGTDSCGLRQRQLPIDGRRPPAGIRSIDPLPVVVDHDVTEDDGLHLLHGHLFGMDAIEFFLFEGGKKALHSGVIIASPGTAHALNGTIFRQGVSEGPTGELAASVGV